MTYAQHSLSFWVIEAQLHLYTPSSSPLHDSLVYKYKYSSPSHSSPSSSCPACSDPPHLNCYQPLPSHFQPSHSAFSMPSVLLHPHPPFLSNFLPSLTFLPLRPIDCKRLPLRARALKGC